MKNEHRVEYGNFTSCEIDDGSLDGKRPVEIFMAGVQWGMANEAIRTGAAFSTFVYPWNADRMCSLCRSKGYRARLEPAGDVVQIRAEPI